MSKLNEQRVELFKKGKVVLYTGDKKGSDEVVWLLRRVGMNPSGDMDFYGTIPNSKYINFIDYTELNNRPTHPIEWFYEEDLTRRLKDFDDGYKEGYQDGISGVKSKY